MPKHQHRTKVSAASGTLQTPCRGPSICAWPGGCCGPDLRSVPALYLRAGDGEELPCWQYLMEELAVVSAALEARPSGFGNYHDQAASIIRQCEEATAAAVSFHYNFYKHIRETLSDIAAAATKSYEELKKAATSLPDLPGNEQRLQAVELLALKEKSRHLEEKYRLLCRDICNKVMHRCVCLMQGMTEFRASSPRAASRFKQLLTDCTLMDDSVKSLNEICSRIEKLTKIIEAQLLLLTGTH